MDHPAIAEVVRQHVVIEQWLSGTDRAGFDSFVAALADEFEIVTPDGETVRKPELVEGFGAAFGASPGVKIEAKSARVLAETDGLVVVHYEEWQSECEQPNQRVSTAVFAPRDSAPLGWSWLALHETWLH
jgi:hypothetical protein